MSLPGDAERKLLEEIAFILREVIEERGHHVDSALAVDRAFGSGKSRAALTRDLAMDAIELGASQVGSIMFRHVNGEGRELVGARHRYRLRRARWDAAGDLVITTSSESSLGIEEEETLFPLESWVFGWTFESALIADVFIAKILGVKVGKPGRLILGSVHLLGSGDPFGGGFTPSVDDDLPGFEDERDDDAGGAAGDVKS
jgi:hypothetical protein